MCRGVAHIAVWAAVCAWPWLCGPHARRSLWGKCATPSRRREAVVAGDPAHASSPHSRLSRRRPPPRPRAPRPPDSRPEPPCRQELVRRVAADLRQPLPPVPCPAPPDRIAPGAPWPRGPFRVPSDGRFSVRQDALPCRPGDLSAAAPRTPRPGCGVPVSHARPPLAESKPTPHGALAPFKRSSREFLQGCSALSRSPANRSREETPTSSRRIDADT